MDFFAILWMVRTLLDATAAAVAAIAATFISFYNVLAYLFTTNDRNTTF
jgi:hypothetical protein